MLLKADNIRTFYGKTCALDDVSVSVANGEIVTILGKNGAGKSTLFKSIIGLTKPTQGRVYFAKKEISNIPAHQIPRLGIAYVPQDGKVFPNLTVAENFAIALFDKVSTRGIHDRVRSAFQDMLPDSSLFMKILKILIDERHRQAAGTLSGGEQQILSIARAIITEPRLFIIDEPTVSLSFAIIQELSHLVLSLRKQGVSVFIIEQRVKWALNVSNKVYIMQKGNIVFEGSSKSLLDNEKLLLGFLGIKENQELY